MKHVVAYHHTLWYLMSFRIKKINKMRCLYPLILFMVIISSCATVGPAPAKLSAEVGDRIAEMEALHQQTLKSYFDNERDRVEQFLNDKWIPQFLKNFLAISGLLNDISATTFVGEGQKELLEKTLAQYIIDPSEVSQAGDKIVKAIDDNRKVEDGAISQILNDYVEDNQLSQANATVSAVFKSDTPGQLILEWAEDAQVEINKRRKELLDPLNKAEQHVSAELTASYSQLLKANGVVTARLEAAAKVKTLQDEVLQAFNVKGQADVLRSKLADLSGTVGSAISAGDKILNTASSDSNNANNAFDAIKDGLSDLLKSSNN